MAVMEFREPNQAKWVGTRPGHDGTQKYWQASSNVIGKTALIPVHASKTRYITYFEVGMVSNVVNTASLRVHNNLLAMEWEFGAISGIVGFLAPRSVGQFWPPFELPFNWTLDLFIQAAQWAWASVLGWEE